MSDRAVHSSRKRRRFTPIALITGLAGVALLSLSVTGTLSGFTASITNSTNTAGSGSLVMQEQTTGGTAVTCLSTDGGSVSTNTASCATINKFGGSTTLVPGGPAVNTAITIKNIGSVPASTFTLTPGATCTQSNNGTQNGTAADFCAKLKVVITSGATTVFTGTAATLAGAAAGATSITMPPAPAAGVSTPFNIAVSLDSTVLNNYQGLAASLPLTWAFAS
ncbi:hypothetical protein IV498_16860 [Paenarthrobacter sp. Z7-10]|uniref:hypothetical protein n=1 Tax=Paenarthrobacter sp. Z7-10 TaxID=2787635 RepID=UPI0022A940C4|nr:hypothetical protein [Paenarthrobacter sp. Z7-10]MCZ2404798.1 hypothetical protein [Paenarthrobacter sp. Z7-10]